MPLTVDLPGTGGTLRSQPEDFRVWEVPAYEPSHEGTHRYFDLTKRGDSTPYALERLSRQLNVPLREIGYAGLKDRHAVTTQRISIPANFAWEGAEGLVEVGLHQNKLKRGHLRGNRFAIRVRDVVPDALERARAIEARLRETGWANLYGSQRFSQDNAAFGRRLLSGERTRLPRWKYDLMIASLQSELFNTYLHERIQAGEFSRIRAGDVCAKLPVGGMFVGQPETEQERLEAFEISYTGPIYGSRMRWPEGAALAAEEQVLLESGLMKDSFRAPGSRRRCRLPLQNFSVTQEEDALLFEFELPAGSYATVLLAEFLKGDGGAEEEDQGPEGGVSA